MILRFTSLQAANADEHVAAIVKALGDVLAMPTEFVGLQSWQMREQMLDNGDVHAGWICGYPYTRKREQTNSPIELLVAPVMEGERYANQPVYFSDVVVHRDSLLVSFADLRGRSWAYNEVGSHSGDHVVRWHLAQLGEMRGYFGRVAIAGSHQTALQWVLEDRVDAAAIDSIVLETELRCHPHLAEEVRVVETLGPSPIPPWVIQSSLVPDLKERVRGALLALHETAAGRTILATGQLRRFAAVEDSDYDPIRQIAHLAQQVTL